MLTTLADTLLSTPVREEWVAIVSVVGTMSVGAVLIVGLVSRSVLRTRAKEQSRREIAAYVAEGSMSAADAERILDAGMPTWERPRRPE